MAMSEHFGQRTEQRVRCGISEGETVNHRRTMRSIYNNVMVTGEL